MLWLFGVSICGDTNSLVLLNFAALRVSMGFIWAEDMGEIAAVFSTEARA